jgi:hypothetical protein
MSLIALHADEHGAQVMTDTLAYTVTARHLRQATKVFALPHLDAAVLAHGGTREFSNFWAVHASLRAGAATFDELADTAPAALAELWREVVAMTEHRNAVYGARSTVPRAIALAVGYSHRHRRFRALAYQSDGAFEPIELHGLWVIPSPLNVRPSTIEQARLEETLQQLHDDADIARLLGQLPEPAVPVTDDEWAALARDVRQQRAVDADLYSGLKMYVGGDALLTRLERGRQSTGRLLTFDDSGAEFTQMMAGSLHPAGQLGQCPCGDGSRFRDCCLAELNDQPCPCGSGRTFASCCRVDHAAGSPPPSDRRDTLAP